jgi:methionyl-tRNA formyltransferase
VSSTPIPSGIGRPVRAVFFGSGPFAVPILDAVADSPLLEIVAVVTPPDRPAGRHGTPVPVPVARRAAERLLPVIHVERVRSPGALATIAATDPAIGILADFGQIIPPAILELPRFGILNVHPSALPRHRGATPIPATILAGDAEAGVSVMQMDAGLDTGPVLACRTWPLNGTEDAPAIEVTAAREGARLLVEVLEDVLAGRASAVVQDSARVTLTRPLVRSDGALDPAAGAAALERRVRALRPWPGTYLEVGGQRLGVLEAALSAGGPDDQAGHLLADDDGIAIGTASGRLRLLVVQPAGGRPMSGPEFRRGHATLVGQPLNSEAVR